jgi:DNA polymerase
VFATHGKIYEASAARSLGIEMSQVTKKLRSMGKVQELALGFQGGVGALRRFGAVRRYGMDEAQLLPTVKAWRDASPNIVRHWYDSERAALAALRRPRSKHPFGRARFASDGRHLYMQLPSGRLLWYRDAWEQDKCIPGTDVLKPAAFFKGEDERGGWGTQDTYGGKLTENATQAVARDVLAEGKLNAVAAGLPLVLSVHDELVAEVPESQADLAALQRAMTTLPGWAEGLPVATEGWVGNRYRK